MISEQPLVSIIMWIKDGERTVERAIKSLLAQEYQNYEFLVQDGASQDGTLDIFRSYFDRFAGRIKIISEPDRCGEEGFFRALKRCRGEIICSCLADEELTPDACHWAIKNFREHPDCGAIYGDVYGTDIDGNITGTDPIKEDFDLLRYICHEIIPPFSSSFFRRECLEAIGLHSYPWTLSAGEFELWVRLGMRYPIKHLPGFVSKFASHPDCQTSRPDMYGRMVEERKAVIERFFSAPEYAHLSREFKATAIAGMHTWMAWSILNTRALDQARRHVEEAVKQQPVLDPNRVRHLANNYAVAWRVSVSQM